MYFPLLLRVYNRLVMCAHSNLRGVSQFWHARECSGMLEECSGMLGSECSGMLGEALIM